MSKQYKTDLHCHTRDGSCCAGESTRDTIEKYIKQGYTSIVLTNHMQSYRINGGEPFPFSFPSYEDYVDYCYDAIDLARRVADGRLYVLDGFEMRIPYCTNDYLVYGLERECVKAFNIIKAELDTASKYIRENGGVIVQAHPMRFGMTLVRPEYIDGYEVHNSHNKPFMNTMIREWIGHIGADDKIFTAGTDHHNHDDIPSAGILTEAPIKTTEELISVLKSRSFKIFPEE